MAAATITDARANHDLKQFLGWIANQRNVNPHNPIGSLIPFKRKIAVPATSVDDANDKIRILKFPPAAFLDYFAGTPTDMDSGANLVYDVIVETDAAVETTPKIVAASTKAQAASGTDEIAAAARGLYVGGLWLVLKTTTGAAGGALAGSYSFYLRFSLGVITASQWPSLVDPSGDTY